MIRKLAGLARSDHRIERAFLRGEIWFNRAFLADAHRPPEAVELQHFARAVQDRWSDLSDYMSEGGDGRFEFDAAQVAASNLATHPALPFPLLYNADSSLALLCYAFARSIPCRRAVELGVGYGMTSRLILAGMARAGGGELTSIDLASLADPGGMMTGWLVPNEYSSEWRLIRGTSRRLLHRVLDHGPGVDLFISDSANVFTLQRWEVTQVWPKLRPGGVAILNNVGHRLMTAVQRLPGALAYGIAQQEKVGCVTCVIIKG